MHDTSIDAAHRQQKVNAASATVIPLRSGGRIFRDEAAGSASLGLALDLASRGFAIFPCGLDKKPLLSKEDGGNGYRDATRDPAKIRAWWQRWPDAWIGICPGRSDPPQAVLDIDVKNGQPGMDSLATFEIEGLLPPTRTVRTPSGGLHLWYIKPAGAPAIGGSDLAPGINVKADLGYVLYYGEGDGEPAEAPAELIRCLTAPREKSLDAGKPAPGIELDTPAQIRRATDLARKLCQDGPAAHRYRKACAIKDEGVSEAECLRIMREVGFAEDGQTSLEQKVTSAYRNGQNAIGSKVAEAAETLARLKAKATADAEARPDGTPKRRRPAPVSARELAQRPAPAPKPYVWADLLPQGHVTMLYGDGGVGKGRVAMELAVACAAGVGELFGHAIQPMPAIFVSVEDDEDELRRRAEAIAAKHGKAMADLDLHVWSLVGEDAILAEISDRGEVTFGDFYEHLAEELAARFAGRPHLLILDALAGLVVLDEAKRAPTRAFASRVLAPLCKEAGSTGLVLAHPSKASMQDGTYYAGSTDWNNAFRNRMTLERVDSYGPGHFTLRLSRAKTNVGIGGQELTLWSAPGSAALFDMPPQETAASRQEEQEAVVAKIVELTRHGDRVTLNNRSSGVGPRALSNSLGWPEAKVRDHLEAIRASGRLSYREAGAGSHAKAGFILPDPSTDAPADPGEDARRQAMAAVLEECPGTVVLPNPLACAVADKTGDTPQAILAWLDAIARDPAHPLNKRYFAGTTTTRAGQQWRTPRSSAQEN